MDKLLFKRILVTILSILAIIYAVYLIFSSNFDMYKTENVVKTTVTDTIYSNGFIIRDESIVSSDKGGVLSYSISDGAAINADGEIAKIYSDDTNAAAQSKAEKLEETMNSLKTIQDNYSHNSVGIDTITNSINDNLNSLISNVNGNDIKSLNANISGLISSINQRQLYTGKVENFNEEINNLKVEIDNLKKSSSESIGEIKSDKSGYFSSHCDGYEKSFDYKNIDKMTLKDFEKIDSESIDDNTVGKVVNNIHWYIACKVTADEATALSLWDSEATVKFPNAYTDVIPAQIYRIHHENDSDSALLILKCNYMNSELVDARREPIEIGLGTYTGLRISKKAIHDDFVKKTVYDDNDQKHIEKKKVQGVYVLYGSEIHFKQINILYADEDYVICDDDQNSDKLFNGETVSLYDKIVIDGAEIYDGKIIE